MNGSTPPSGDQPAPTPRTALERLRHHVMAQPEQKLRLSTGMNACILERDGAVKLNISTVTGAEHDVALDENAASDWLEVLGLNK